MDRALRVRFFKKIQDWILESERIRKRILRFFTQQINPRSLGSWCVKGTEESTPRVFGFFRIQESNLGFSKETHPLSPSQPCFGLSRNARDSPKNGCEGDSPSCKSLLCISQIQERPSPLPQHPRAYPGHLMRG